MSSRRLTTFAFAALFAASLNGCDGFGTGLTGVARTPSGLVSLALSAGQLDPVFASATTDYTANVANAVTAISLTPTVTTEGSTVLVNGNPVASGASSPPIPLLVGGNTIEVVVTNPDGLTTRLYTIQVTRSPF
jgi:trimeric autotransporter adhesin